MGEFALTKNGKTVTFCDGDKLLTAVEAFLGVGEPLIVSIPKAAVAVFKGLNDLFKRNGIEMVLTVDDDPQAIDYFVHSALGGSIGALAGGAVGVGILALAARHGHHIPYVGWVISGAALVGLALGAATGATVTRMGLRAKFSPLDPEVVDVSLAPAPA